MHTESLADHEAADLHEMMNLKTLNLAKSKLMQGLVFDQELKDLMQKDVVQTMKGLEDLKTIYTRAPFQTEIPEFRPTSILNGGEKG
ncbi:spore gernimation protein GerQ [Neobacillus mesonae]|nr:spore gernimation protein GerQ [Neobacillus mesonae]